MMSMKTMRAKVYISRNGGFEKAVLYVSDRWHRLYERRVWMLFSFAVILALALIAFAPNQALANTGDSLDSPREALKLASGNMQYLTFNRWAWATEFGSSPRQAGFSALVVSGISRLAVLFASIVWWALGNLIGWALSITSVSWINEDGDFWFAKIFYSMRTAKITAEPFGSDMNMFAMILLVLGVLLLLSFLRIIRAIRPKAVLISILFMMVFAFVGDKSVSNHTIDSSGNLVRHGTTYATLYQPAKEMEPLSYGSIMNFAHSFFRGAVGGFVYSIMDTVTAIAEDVSVAPTSVGTCEAYVNGMHNLYLGAGNGAYQLSGGLRGEDSLEINRRYAETLSELKAKQAERSGSYSELMDVVRKLSNAKGGTDRAGLEFNVGSKLDNSDWAKLESQKDYLTGIIKSQDAYIDEINAKMKTVTEEYIAERSKPRRSLEVDRRLDTIVRFDRLYLSSFRDLFNTSAYGASRSSGNAWCRIADISATTPVGVITLTSLAATETSPSITSAYDFELTQNTGIYNDAINPMVDSNLDWSTDEISVKFLYGYFAWRSTEDSFIPGYVSASSFFGVGSYGNQNADGYHFAFAACEWVDDNQRILSEVRMNPEWSGVGYATNPGKTGERRLVQIVTKTQDHPCNYLVGNVLPERLASNDVKPSSDWNGPEWAGKVLDLGHQVTRNAESNIDWVINTTKDNLEKVKDGLVDAGNSIMSGIVDAANKLPFVNTQQSGKQVAGRQEAVTEEGAIYAIFNGKTRADFGDIFSREEWETLETGLEEGDATKVLEVLTDEKMALIVEIVERQTAAEALVVGTGVGSLTRGKVLGEYFAYDIDLNLFGRVSSVLGFTVTEPSTQEWFGGDNYRGNSEAYGYWYKVTGWGSGVSSLNFVNSLLLAFLSFQVFRNFVGFVVATLVGSLITMVDSVVLPFVIALAIIPISPLRVPLKKVLMLTMYAMLVEAVFAGFITLQFMMINMIRVALLPLLGADGIVGGTGASLSRFLLIAISIILGTSVVKMVADRVFKVDSRSIKDMAISASGLAGVPLTGGHNPWNPKSPNSPFKNPFKKKSGKDDSSPGKSGGSGGSAVRAASGAIANKMTGAITDTARSLLTGKKKEAGQSPTDIGHIPATDNRKIGDNSGKSDPKILGPAPERLLIEAKKPEDLVGDNAKPTDGASVLSPEPKKVGQEVIKQQAQRLMHELNPQEVKRLTEETATESLGVPGKELIRYVGSSDKAETGVPPAELPELGLKVQSDVAERLQRVSEENTTNGQPQYLSLTDGILTRGLYFGHGDILDVETDSAGSTSAAQLSTFFDETRFSGEPTNAAVSQFPVSGLSDVTVYDIPSAPIFNSRGDLDGGVYFDPEIVEDSRVYLPQTMSAVQDVLMSIVGNKIVQDSQIPEDGDRFAAEEIVAGERKSLFTSVELVDESGKSYGKLGRDSLGRLIRVVRSGDNVENIEVEEARSLTEAVESVSVDELAQRFETTAGARPRRDAAGNIVLDLSAIRKMFDL